MGERACRGDGMRSEATGGGGRARSIPVQRITDMTTAWGAADLQKSRAQLRLRTYGRCRVQGPAEAEDERQVRRPEMVLSRHRMMQTGVAN